MTRRIVFVPIFGDDSDITADNWREVPHVKLWGYILDDAPTSVWVLHHEGVGGASTDFDPNSPIGLFDNELELAVDIDGDTDVPPIVSQRLAQLALAPETLPVRED